MATPRGFFKTARNDEFCLTKKPLYALSHRAWRVGVIYKFAEFTSPHYALAILVQMLAKEPRAVVAIMREHSVKMI